MTIKASMAGMVPIPQKSNKTKSPAQLSPINLPGWKLDQNIKQAPMAGAIPTDIGKSCISTDVKTSPLDMHI